MRVLITGCDGFVGKYLIESLEEHELYGFGLAENVEGLNYKKVDITNAEEVLNFVQIAKPDWVFHLAAISNVVTCTNNPELTHKVNVEGTLNLMKAIKTLDSIPKILLTSTAYVYGKPQYLPIDENHPVQPLNIYGKTKLEQENAALSLELPVIICRSFNHIGPGQSLGFVATDFAKQIVDIENDLQEEKIIVGNLEPKRDFTDVRDVVNAYITIISQTNSGIFNVGSGESIEIKELLEKLIELSGLDIEVIIDEQKFRPNEVMDFVADNTKLKNLGWKARTSIDVSLSDLLNDMRQLQ